MRAKDCVSKQLISALSSNKEILDKNLPDHVIGVCFIKYLLLWGLSGILNTFAKFSSVFKFSNLVESIFRRRMLAFYLEYIVQPRKVKLVLRIAF